MAPVDAKGPPIFYERVSILASRDLELGVHFLPLRCLQRHLQLGIVILSFSSYFRSNSRVKALPIAPSLSNRGFLSPCSCSAADLISLTTRKDTAIPASAYSTVRLHLRMAQRQRPVGKGGRESLWRDNEVNYCGSLAHAQTASLDPFGIPNLSPFCQRG